MTRSRLMTQHPLPSELPEIWRGMSRESSALAHQFSSGESPFLNIFTRTLSECADELQAALDRQQERGERR